MNDIPDHGLSTRFSRPMDLSPLQHGVLRPGIQRSERPNDTITVGFAWRVLRQWWKVVLPLSMLLAAAGGAVVWMTFQPKYRTTAWLLIKEQPDYLAYKSDPSARFVQNQIELLRSPLVLERVLANPEVARLAEVASQISPLEWLQKNLTAKNVGGSDIFELSFAGPSATDVTSIINAIIDAYYAVASARTNADRQKIIQLLDVQKENREKDVVRLRQDVKDLAKQINAQDPFAPPSLNRETFGFQNQRSALEDREISTEVEREVAQAELTALQESNAAGTITISDDVLDQYVDSRSEIIKYDEDLAQYRQRLQDSEHALQPGANAGATLSRMKAQLAAEEQRRDELRTKLKAVLAKELLAAGAKKRQESIATLQQKVTNLQRQEKLLKEKVNSLTEGQQRVGDNTVELEFRKEELKRAEAVHQRIAERMLALNTEALAPDRVEIWRKAAAPNEPEVKYPWKLLAVVCTSLFLFPFVIILAWERHICRILDSDQFAAEAELRVVGEVAMLPRRHVMGPTGTKQLSWSRHLFEESIDSLRTSLVLSDNLKDLKVIAVVSAVSQEGKTSLAAQLAVSLSRASDEPVLLIDADLRSPELHNVFDIPKEPGLVKALSNGTAARDSIRPTAVNPLVHLLPAGRLHKSPHSLFGRGHLKSLVDELRNEYRYIVIDTPPVLSASESLVVAKAADGALICTLRESSRAGQVRLTYQRLQAAGARVIGVVLSGVPTKTYAYRYGSYGYNKPLA